MCTVEIFVGLSIDVEDSTTEDALDSFKMCCFKFKEIVLDSSGPPLLDGRLVTTLNGRSDSVFEA